MTEKFKPGDRAVINTDEPWYSGPAGQTVSSSLTGRQGEIVTIVKGPDIDGDYEITFGNGIAQISISQNCLSPVDDEPAPEGPEQRTFAVGDEVRTKTDRPNPWRLPRGTPGIVNYGPYKNGSYLVSLIDGIGTILVSGDCLEPVTDDEVPDVFGTDGTSSDTDRPLAWEQLARVEAAQEAWNTLYQPNSYGVSVDVDLSTLTGLAEWILNGKVTK